MNLKQTLKNKTLRNAGWIVGGRLMNKALSFLVGILTARYLGPGNYGLINYVAAYVTFFTSLCNLGINSVIIKEFVDHPQEQGKALGTALVMQAVSSFLSAVMIVGIVFVVDKGDPTTVLVAVLSSLGLLFQIFDTLKKWFQNRLQSKYASIATVVAYLVVSGYKLVLLMRGSSVIWFALSTSVEYLVVAAFLLIAYKKNKGPAFSFSWQKGKAILATSSSYILSGLMVAIYASTDKLMLEHMLDKAAVGHYSLAVSISSMWVFLLEAIIDSVYPSVIRAHQEDRELFEKRNRQMYAIVIYAALGVSLVICLLAKPIVGILYGKEYLPAVAPLRVVVWYTAFAYLGVARNAWIVSENKQKYLKYLYIGAAVMNVLLNLALIPLWGGAGAALASLITQFATVVILPLLIPPLRPNVKLMLQALLLQKLK